MTYIVLQKGFSLTKAQTMVHSLMPASAVIHADCSSQKLPLSEQGLQAWAEKKKYVIIT